MKVVQLNGQGRDKAWFTHRQLISGGRITLTMASAPNVQFGADATSIPPSLSFDARGYLRAPDESSFQNQD